jgi:hypothetical protein
MEPSLIQALGALSAAAEASFVRRRVPVKAA